MRFLLEHNDSPLSPLMMQKELLYTISFDEANRLRQSMNPALDGHPYEEAFSNAVLAKNIGIGSELPNITMPTADNKEIDIKRLPRKIRIARLLGFLVPDRADVKSPLSSSFTTRHAA